MQGPAIGRPSVRGRMSGAGARDASAPGARTWLLALLLFAMTDPIYPLLIRGWSEWVTDFSEVNRARKVAWAGIYLAAAVATLLWREAAWRSLASHAWAPAALVWFGASALWAPDPTGSALGFAQFALLLGFGAAAGGRLGPLGVVQAVARAAWLALAAGLAMAVLSPQHAFGQHVNAGAFRGVYVEKNQFAMLLSFGVAAGAFEALARPGRARLWAGTAALLVALVAARSSIALLQAGAVMALAAGRTGLAGARFGGAALAAGALGAAAALIAGLPAALSALGEDLTLNGRTTLWAALWPDAAAASWIGRGFSGYWDDAAEARLLAELGWNARGAHSGWLTALLFGGAVGAALWLLLWLGVARRAAAALAPGAPAAPAGLAALAAVHLLWSLFETTQLMQMNVHAAIAGLCLSLPSPERAPRRIAEARPGARSRNSGLPIT